MSLPEPAGTPQPAALDADDPSDEDLLKILREREEEERDQAKEAAKKLEPGLCPVCESALTPKPAPAYLAPVVSREELVCAKCGFKAEPLLTPIGWMLGYALALYLAYAGMGRIFSAQRIPDPDGQKMMFLIGAALFGAGLFVWYWVHEAGGVKRLSQRILAKRRRLADERAGIPVLDEDPGGGWFGENLEAVVVAVILALIIRHFAMEAFVIPTGSMAPTLLGDHFDVTCDNCGNRFSLSKAETEFAARSVTEAGAQCPQCDHQFSRELTRGHVLGGHKILVNKFIYKIRPPRRYEVIVFKFPLAPWRNYIKRLVGLPGETIEVKNGDLFADGKLARKPDHVQDAVWIPVHDGKNRRADGPPRWEPVEEETPEGVWQLGPPEGSRDLDGAWVRCDPAKQKDPKATAWLRYTRAIYDSYGYNRTGGFGRFRVADLRARARVTPSSGAVVRLTVVEISSDEEGKKTRRVVSGRFVTGPGEVEYAIEVDGEPQHTTKGPGLVPDQPVELAFSYADDRGRLQVNGETVAAWDDFLAPAATFSSEVRVGAARAPAVFERLRIDRDVYYVPSIYLKTDPSNGAVRVPDRSYFVMGDNSPNSEDGRKWGFVREGHLIGRAFLVFWPVVPWQLKLIR